MKRQKHLPEKENELMKFVLQVVEKEKLEEANPFLAERVMAEIEKYDPPAVIPIFRRIFQMAAIAAGLALIVFAGINLGTFAGKKFAETNTMVLLNDAHIERIEFLVTE